MVEASFLKSVEVKSHVHTLTSLHDEIRSAFI